MSRKKELYMTKEMTLEALNKKVDEGSKTISNSDTKLLIKSGDKMYEEAKKAMNDGDEERAYVLFMRLLEIYKNVQKSPKFLQDKEYYTRLMGKSKIVEALEKCEQLSVSLKERYELMRLAQKHDSDSTKKEITELNAREKEKQDSKNNHEKSTSATKGPSTINGIVKHVEKEEEKVVPNSSSINVRQLKSLIDQKSTKFLIIDCRSHSDFIRSHVIHTDCISIPQELLVPGMSANKIELRLKQDHPESYIKWQKRGTYDRIILYDWNSSLENQQPTMSTLYSALTEWDRDTKHRSPPAVLAGGLKNLYYSYPNLLNKPENASEYLTEKETVPTSRAVLDLISYPDLDDDDHSNNTRSSSPNPKLKNGFSGSELSSTNSTNNNNNFNKLNSTASATFDRSVKPKLSSSSTTTTMNGPTGNYNKQQEQFIDHSQKTTKNLTSTNNVLADQTETKRAALTAALDDLIRSSEEVKKHEEDLDQQLNKAPTSVDKNNDMNKKLLDKIEELNKVILNKDENLRILKEDFEALQAKKTKPVLPQIRQTPADAMIESKFTQKKELDEYVKTLREKRKEKERSESIRLPVINSPKISPRTVGKDVTESTVFPVINSSSEVNNRVFPSSNQDSQPSSVKQSSSGGLLRPMSQDASPITFQKLKGDSTSDSPRSSLLKRSHSHPNIAQSLNEEDVSLEETIPSTPSINRTLKPSTARPPDAVTPNRARDFHAVNSTEWVKTGLKNLGNTCYMNSIMQCINHLPMLVDYFISEAYVAHHKKDRAATKGEISTELAAALKVMSHGHRSIALNDFKNIVGRYHPSFRGYEQQDSHELLTILLDWLHEELNQVPKTPLKEQKNDGLSDSEASQKVWADYCASNNSKISQLFCGQQKSSVRCEVCRKESVTFEAFFNLSVPIPSTNRKVDIQQCIDLYTSEEIVPGWNCVHCKASVKATKKIDLWRLPPYLIIHLQRFYNDGWWKKRLTEVDFPVDSLELTSRVKGSQGSQDFRAPRLCFQLQAVSNHYGSMDGGHYTAYCRRKAQWAKFDDHEVSPINSRDVVTPAAYILFYSNSSP